MIMGGEATGQQPPNDLSFVYFVSYSHPDGFGSREVKVEFPITEYAEIVEIGRQIARGANLPEAGVAVVGYQLLRGPGLVAVGPPPAQVAAADQAEAELGAQVDQLVLMFGIAALGMPMTTADVAAWLLREDGPEPVVLASMLAIAGKRLADARG